MFIKGHICGIYKILCFSNKKIYVGSSVNIIIRWSFHKSQLNRNVHANILLQRAWNKYGENNFKFEIIEIVKSNLLITKEKFWIKKFKSNNRKYGFNIAEPNKPPMLGRLHSKKTKSKMSISHFLHGHNMTDIHKNIIIKFHTGRKRTQETKTNISLSLKGLRLGSKNPNAKLTNKIIKKIRLDYEKYKQKNKNKYKKSIFRQLIEKYHLTKSHLIKIVYRKIWKHI